jgi:hypothetical protein
MHKAYNVSAIVEHFEGVLGFRIIEEKLKDSGSRGEITSI